MIKGPNEERIEFVRNSDKKGGGTYGKRKQNGKVPLISKIAYGFGDVGCNFSWMFVSNFLMIFYTDVFGISMAAVSALMLFKILGCNQ